MKTKTLRIFCKLMCLVLVASFALEAPLLAAFDSIPVKIGSQVFQVTPGQWVTVRQGTQITHYNVRYVNGHPVALEASQYTKLIFGEATPNPNPGSGVSEPTGSTGKPANTTTKPSSNGSSGSSTNGEAQVGTNPRENSGVNSVVGATSENPSTALTGGPVRYKDPQTGRFVKAGTPGAVPVGGGAVAPTPESNGTPAFSGETSGSTGSTSGGTIRYKDPQTGRFVKAGTPGAVPVGGGTVVGEPISASTEPTVGSRITGETSGSSSASGGSTSSTTAGKVRYKDPQTGRFVKAGTPGAVPVGGETVVPSSEPFAGTAVTGETSGSTVPTTGGKVRYKDPQTGRFVKAGTPGAVPVGGETVVPSSEPVVGSAVTGETSGSPAPTTAGKVRYKDPQTGRFVKAGTPGAVPVGGEPVSASTESTSASKIAGEPTTGGEVSGQAGEGEPGFWDKTKGNFKDGYDLGKGKTNVVIGKTKAMAGQGVQNVKDSLKSGFSGKNLLVTAGITVGVDLATQIMNGEKPSVKKALKTVASAEFVGGVAGSVTGAAAGSFFVPFLTAIPVVGGVLGALAPTFGSVVGGSVGAYLAGDIKNGRFSIRDAFRRVDWVGVAGQTVGSTVGALLGSALGPVGTVIGGMVGGFIGNWAAHKIAGIFNKGGQSGEPIVSVPIGTMVNRPNGDGSITIGGNQAGNQIDSGNSPIVLPGDGEVTIDSKSDVDVAFEAYQDLYKLYNDLVGKGKTQDAMKVAPELNKAKARYDQLRASAK